MCAATALPSSQGSSSKSSQTTRIPFPLPAKNFSILVALLGRSFRVCESWAKPIKIRVAIWRRESRDYVLTITWLYTHVWLRLQNTDGSLDVTYFRPRTSNLHAIYTCGEFRPRVGSWQKDWSISWVRILATAASTGWNYMMKTGLCTSAFQKLR